MVSFRLFELYEKETVSLQSKIILILMLNFNAAERVKKTFMQNEQLTFKNILKYETDQLKTKSTDLFQNQQTSMLNKRYRKI